ncbi:MAG: ATP synthase F1 subunit delta [Candidatus Omnitrophica bacterium]|nr:ATP synthase F1 subunit delta [Candidatus Omnitrophota bacterium]
MKLKLIARRYAEAFIEYAKETIGVERAAQETAALMKITKANPEFMGILASPALADSEKYEFIDTVLKNYFSVELLQFLKLIIEKKRIQFLSDIVDYIIVNYIKQQEANAVVRCAYPIDPGVLKILEQKMQAKSDKKLNFTVTLDKNIIGGLRIETGNTVVDASIGGRLEELRKKLKNAEVL